MLGHMLIKQNNNYKQANLQKHNLHQLSLDAQIPQVITTHTSGTTYHAGTSACS